MEISSSGNRRHWGQAGEGPWGAVPLGRAIPPQCWLFLAESERCTVYGDPTYRTFDGLGYRFQGRMTYYLVKTVDVLPTGVEPFIVEGRNKMYASHNPVFLHEIIVMVYGYTVQLQHELELVVRAGPGRVGRGRQVSPGEATRSRWSQGFPFPGRFLAEAA